MTRPIIGTIHISKAQSVFVPTVLSLRKTLITAHRFTKAKRAATAIAKYMAESGMLYLLEDSANHTPRSACVVLAPAVSTDIIDFEEPPGGEVHPFRAAVARSALAGFA